MTTPKITVVGSFVVGLTIRVPRMPVLGESLFGDEFDMGPGGKGTNQAIGAARLGAQVSLLACIGDDPFAAIAHDVYQQEGIAREYIRQIPNVNTAVGFVQLVPSGDNWIVGHLGANQHMRPEHVDEAEDLIAQSDIVLTQFEVPPEVVLRALELGRKHGALTVWNPAPAQLVAPTFLELVDVLTPNETELRILLDLPPSDPTPDEELAQRLLELGTRQLVVTRGKKGAILATAEDVEYIPAVSDIAAVDVTGAGDSFNAALAVGLGEGLDLRQAAIWASRAGAYAVQHLGVINGLPTRAELSEFTEKTGG